MWWVLVASALGWVFDVMDQRIFVLSRGPALDELLSVKLEESSLRQMTAGKAAVHLGVEPGISPDALVEIAEPQDGKARPALLLPPLKDDGSGKASPRKFSLVRSPQGAGKVWLLPSREENLLIGRVATAIFLAGWAAGGLLFGILGDKLGRAFTMMLTILIYSIFTGLSALSVSWIDYSFYRFMTGMGVGGEFAAGAALVAEVMPPRARPYALGLLQALSALGNIAGSLIATFVLPAEKPAESWEHWRALYLVGILPALLVVIMFKRLKEPERWRAVKESPGELLGKQLGAFGDLFSPRWRQSTLFGMLFAVSGVIGVWGIGFWTPELISSIVPAAEYRTVATALQDVGAFLGLSAITILTQGAPRARVRVYLPCLAISILAAEVLVCLGAGSVEKPVTTALLGISLSLLLYFAAAAAGAFTGGYGRRVSFLLSFLMAQGSIFIVFHFMRDPGQIYWMSPVMGFAILMSFGMYAIYFPELYPTRLRTTGTGFCYNVARFIAAGGLFFLSYLGTFIDFRTSAQIFSLIYVLGITASFFAPETKDRPLVED
jgi:MFS family permease